MQDPELESLATALQATLGDRLVAVYRYGSDFARGPQTARSRLLVLVDAVDRELLARLAESAVGGRNDELDLVVETPTSLLASTDAFPILALDLIHTKALLAGRDVLKDLQVSHADLRLGVERSLRVIHRKLVAVFVGRERAELARELRRSARRAVYAIEALMIDRGLGIPAPGGAAEVLGALPKLIPDVDREAWERLRRFADGETSPKDLVGVYTATVSAIGQLVDYVDSLDNAASNAAT